MASAGETSSRNLTQAKLPPDAPDLAAIGEAGLRPGPRDASRAPSTSAKLAQTALVRGAPAIEYEKATVTQAFESR